jgi:signal transduction histidine kinase
VSSLVLLFKAPPTPTNNFNRFEQAECSTANSYGGTGLGFAIVKQTRELGGSIS